MTRIAIHRSTPDNKPQDSNRPAHAARFQSSGLARIAQNPEIYEETLILANGGVTIWSAIHLPYC